MSTGREVEVVEDHSVCGDVRISAHVKHMCNEWAGHLGSHECGCGLFWLNEESVTVLG